MVQFFVLLMFSFLQYDQLTSQFSVLLVCFSLKEKEKKRSWRWLWKMHWIKKNMRIMINSSYWIWHVTKSDTKSINIFYLLSECVNWLMSTKSSSNCLFSSRSSHPPKRSKSNIIKLKMCDIFFSWISNVTLNKRPRVGWSSEASNIVNSSSSNLK